MDQAEPVVGLVNAKIPAFGLGVKPGDVPNRSIPKLGGEDRPRSRAGGL